MKQADSGKMADITKYKGPHPPAWYTGNGCGALGTGIFDRLLKWIGFAAMSEPCRWHDWAYEKLREKTATFERIDADNWFFENIKTEAHNQGLKFRGWIVRWVAYRVVRRFGGLTF